MTFQKRSNDILEITESFAELKSHMVMLFTNAETVKEYGVLDRVVNYSLTWLVRDIKNVKECAANKSFSSVESANKEINSIKEKIANIKSKLYEEGVA